ncbi:hypothetical protein BC829DRAFT_445639 [Chytridium lagenaria]|nr:hypothetical protein BC829DRAFT_445639 [Chytridium lagenaria]
MTWAVYGAAGKKRKAWMGTWEALLGVALKTQPMDLGMVAKAKAKVFAAKDEWRRESFGVVMDWVAELGDEGDLNRCLARMKAKRVRPTRAVRNAILKFWSLRFKPRSVLSHHSKYTTSSPDHTTHQYVMEAIYQLRQAADTSPTGYTDSTLNALRNDLHARVEIPLTTQLLNGEPLVGPATWDLLVACYARIGARDDAVRTFGVLKEMVEGWKEKGTYGFMKGEGIVLGSTLIDGMMVAFGGLRDVEGMEKLCGEFVFTRESIERHYKGFMRKMERSGGDANILEEPGRIKDEENDNEEVEIDEANSLKGTLEVDTPKIPTSILEVDPFEKSYKAFVEGWFESSEDEGDIVEVLRKLRQEEKKKVEEYGLKLPL